MPREEKETQVFITNLPKNVTEEEVTDLFDRYGEIQKITIKPNYVFVVRRSSLYFFRLLRRRWKLMKLSMP